MMFTPDQIDAAHAETERLSRELDITNADHIALWLEQNALDENGRLQAGWLAVRIVEAYEAANDLPDCDWDRPLTAKEQGMIDAAWEKHRDAQPCLRPPQGWYCTRTPGHDGPCAAHRIPGDAA